jgi:hypothetical protein
MHADSTIFTHMDMSEMGPPTPLSLRACTSTFRIARKSLQRAESELGNMLEDGDDFEVKTPMPMGTTSLYNKISEHYGEVLFYSARVNSFSSLGNNRVWLLLCCFERQGC